MEQIPIETKIALALLVIAMLIFIVSVGYEVFINQHK